MSPKIIFMSDVDGFAAVIDDVSTMPNMPLPLPVVLKNVERLHEKCTDGHFCGLPARLIKFDLYRDWLANVYTYRDAQREAA
jgi:hypothetical protein